MTAVVVATTFVSDATSKMVSVVIGSGAGTRARCRMPLVEDLSPRPASDDGARQPCAAIASVDERLDQREPLSRRGRRRRPCERTRGTGRQRHEQARAARHAVAHASACPCLRTCESSQTAVSSASSARASACWSPAEEVAHCRRIRSIFVTCA